MDFWIKTEQCTGCAACANACPKDAITLQWDKKGYSTPVINKELCVDCGICKRACPVYKCLDDIPLVSDGKRSEPKIYAAWSRTYATRYNSTSGGAFSELARTALREGAYISGAIYDENQMVCHTIIDSEAGLEKIRQSKYTQSETGDVFRQIRDLLRKGKKVLYCGSPCQVAGLYEFLGSNPDNLITIDFICRGINSPMAYRAWLDELEDEYGAKATKVWFKNKECGWNTFSTRVDFANGKHYRKTRYEDLYMRAYLERNLFIRPSCTQCEFKGMPRPADITLADFWKIDKELDADLGTSMVVVNSDKGEALFKKTQPRLMTYERTYEEALKGNACLTNSVKHGVYSERFFELLNEGKTFSQAFRIATGDRPKVSVIVAIESPTKFMPDYLDSVCNQNYENLEVLLICGSTDETLRKSINKAAETRPKVRVLTPKGDIVSARNAALREAKGEYIHFSTGREIIYDGLYESIIVQMLDEHASAAAFGWDDAWKKQMCRDAFNGTGNNQALLELMLTDHGEESGYSGYGCQLWNKIFRRDMLFADGEPVEFMENGYYMTEVLWLIRVAFACSKAFFTSATMMRRMVAEPTMQPAFAKMAVSELFEQEIQALQMLEGVQPYAYDMLKRKFFDYEAKLVVSCKKQQLFKMADKLVEHMTIFHESAINKEEVVEACVRIIELEKREAAITQEKNKKITGLEKDRTYLKNKSQRLEKDRTYLKNKSQKLEKDRTYLKNKSQRLEKSLNEYENSSLARAGLKVHKLYRKVKIRVKSVLKRK